MEVTNVTWSVPSEIIDVLKNAPMQNDDGRTRFDYEEYRRRRPKFCIMCGEKLSEESLYCTKCGRKIDDTYYVN